MLNMKDYSRSGHVTRWHSVRVARPQTLSDHHYMVTIIAKEMADLIYKDGVSPKDKLALLEYCLVHDAPELLMGDIPTPVKRRIEALTKDSGNPLITIEDSICEKFVTAKKRVSGTPLAYICKLADLADAINFISVEGIGSHAKLVEKKLHKLFIAKISEAEQAFPELSWNRAFGVLNELLDGEDSQLAFE